MSADPILPVALSVTCPNRWCGARRGARCGTNDARYQYHWRRAKLGLEREFPDVPGPRPKRAQGDERTSP